MVKLTNIF